MLREVLGPEGFARLKSDSFGGPMELNGGFTVGRTCDPRGCALSEARFVFSRDTVWVALIDGQRMRIYGDPPHRARSLLLRDPDRRVWRGRIEDVVREPPQLIQAAVDASNDRSPLRLTVAPHPLPSDPASRPDGDSGAMEIRMRDHNGTFEVPVTINDAITVPFAIDSGASDVSVSAGVMNQLLRAGAVSRSDFLGKQTYHLADGSVVTSQTFRIRVLHVGGREVRNVMGSITNDADSLLLGQSFLQRFRSWSIDNQRQLLVLR